MIHENSKLKLGVSCPCWRSLNLVNDIQALRSARLPGWYCPILTSEMESTFRPPTNPNVGVNVSPIPVVPESTGIRTNRLDASVGCRDLGRAEEVREALTDARTTDWSGVPDVRVIYSYIFYYPLSISDWLIGTAKEESSVNEEKLPRKTREHAVCCVEQ